MRDKRKLYNIGNCLKTITVCIFILIVYKYVKKKILTIPNTIASAKTLA